MATITTLPIVDAPADVKSAVTAVVTALHDTEVVSPKDGPGSNRLLAGQRLCEGQSLVSPNGSYRFKLCGYSEGDRTWPYGSLALYKDDKDILWRSQSGSGDACELLLEDTDNLFLHQIRQGGYHMWSSHTRRRVSGSTAVLSILDTGAAVLESDGAIIWSTDSTLVKVPAPAPKFTLAPSTSEKLDWGQYIPVDYPINSPNKEYSFSLKSDGTLVEKHNASGVTIWSRGTPSTVSAVKLAVTYDCRLVAYGANDEELWTVGSSLEFIYTTALNIHDDGNLEMQRSNPERGGFTSILDNRVSFPIGNDSVSVLTAGQNLAIFQTMKNGDWELGFNTHANVFIRNTRTNETKYYYFNTRDETGATVLKVGRDGMMQIVNAQDRCISRCRSHHEYDWWQHQPTSLTLRESGDACLNNVSQDSWLASQDKISGSDPVMPKGMCRGATLMVGESLVPGQYLVTGEGSYYMVYQTDNNLVVYARDGSTKWAANSQGEEPGKVMLQEDGNLVVYTKSGSAKWTSDSAKWGGEPRLVLQNDGNLSLTIADQEFWTTREHEL